MIKLYSKINCGLGPERGPHSGSRNSAAETTFLWLGLLGSNLKTGRKKTTVNRDTLDRLVFEIFP